MTQSIAESTRLIEESIAEAQTRAQRIKEMLTPEETDELKKSIDLLSDNIVETEQWTRAQADKEIYETSAIARYRDAERKRLADEYAKSVPLPPFLESILYEEKIRRVLLAQEAMDKELSDEAKS
jgi:hypothetical protein